MKKLLIIFSVFILCTLNTQAQPNKSAKGSEMCSHRKMQKVNLQKKSIKSANSPLHSFDVLNYTINIDLVGCLTNPYPNNFKADVLVQFRVDSTLNEITLNADSHSLSIDSIQQNAVSYIHTDDILTIQLDRTYMPGEIAKVHIFYNHANVTDNAFYATGGFVFTDCEPEGARKWFPCYDKPSDKATTDITAKVPLAAKLASNGRLQDSIIEANTIKYHWISRDPVAPYLIVLTARNYYKLDIVNWINPNTSEIIPIRFYYNTGEDPTYIKSIIGAMTTFYSEQFGDHPFEKNGFATLNNEFTWGGMENQTLTSLCPDCWGESLIAHEFAHQWFGDMVTCATWADIFLNEGFATWAEAHWTESQNGYTAYKNELEGNASYYLIANPHWAISTPSWAVTTPDVNTLFNYAITYMKGSCVMHMLRYTLGDDLFFPAMKAYATDTVDFKYKSATIDDFKNKIESESGQELDWFFDQWVYKPDHPLYANIYGIYAGVNGKWNVQFTAKQVEQASLPYFQMPVELKIYFKDGSDSLVRVFNSFNNQTFAFELEKEPSHLEFDPNNEILLKGGSTIVSNADIEASSEDFDLSVMPNPVASKSEISFSLDKPEFIAIDLFDGIGMKLKTVTEKYYSAGPHELDFDANTLKPGIYYIVLRTSNKTRNLKIVKAT